MNWERMPPEETSDELPVKVNRRHPLARAGLVIAAGAAALALWAGLTAASADTTPVVDGKKSVVLTQTDGDGGGHGCQEKDGSASTPANASPSV
jgi:hypothetical protein